MSASRAKDFKQCPLLFRFRTVDRLPEPPSTAAVRGTLVHAILERLFDLPAPERTEEAATTMVGPQWEALVSNAPELGGLFADDVEHAAWLAQVRALIANYFRMENPRRLEPAGRERLVEVEIDGGILLRGYLDRVDVAPSGAIRIVDYKTGKSPSERFSDEALFQMRFYALMLWRLEGVVPARLQLVYLGDGRTLTLDPRQEDLVEFERSVRALWSRIEEATEGRAFHPRRTALCPWCSFQAMCPLFGGTTPPVSEEGLTALRAVRRLEPLATPGGG